MLSIIQNHLPELLSGFEVTLFSSVIALILSLTIGTIMAILQLTKNKIISSLASIYVEVFRNIPLLVIVMFFFIVLPLSGLAIDGFTAGTVGLALYTSAFIAETVRAGILAVPIGQVEAGLSSGFTMGQVYQYIILPQAFKIVIPPLGNQFINLVKNSSILAVAAGLDLMYQGDAIANATFDTVNTYIVIAGFYLILTLPLSYLMNYLERRWSLTGE
ncbi:MAG: amino acid ABC transporter permease [Streptococcaceae bacterium]|jgi:putative glutamine transport system permease protein|nr:amino acid ABC transporter permease [Streptococcaceae bacterium]